MSNENNQLGNHVGQSTKPNFAKSPRSPKTGIKLSNLSPMSTKTSKSSPMSARTTKSSPMSARSDKMLHNDSGHYQSLPNISGMLSANKYNRHYMPRPYPKFGCFIPKSLGLIVRDDEEGEERRRNRRIRKNRHDSTQSSMNTSNSSNDVSVSEEIKPKKEFQLLPEDFPMLPVHKPAIKSNSLQGVDAAGDAIYQIKRGLTAGRVPLLANGFAEPLTTAAAAQNAASKRNGSQGEDPIIKPTGVYLGGGDIYNFAMKHSHDIENAENTFIVGTKNNIDINVQKAQFNTMARNIPYNLRIKTRRSVQPIQNLTTTYFRPPTVNIRSPRKQTSLISIVEPNKNTEKPQQVLRQGANPNEELNTRTSVRPPMSPPSRQKSGSKRQATCTETSKNTEKVPPPQCADPKQALESGISVPQTKSSPQKSNIKSLPRQASLISSTEAGKNKQCANTKEKLESKTSLPPTKNSSSPQKSNIKGPSRQASPISSTEAGKNKPQCVNTKVELETKTYLAPTQNSSSPQKSNIKGPSRQASLISSTEAAKNTPQCAKTKEELETKTSLPPTRNSASPKKSNSKSPSRQASLISSNEAGKNKPQCAYPKDVQQSSTSVPPQRNTSSPQKSYIKSPIWQAFQISNIEASKNTEKSQNTTTQHTNHKEELRREISQPNLELKSAKTDSEIQNTLQSAANNLGGSMPTLLAPNKPSNCENYLKPAVSMPQPLYRHKPGKFDPSIYLRDKNMSRAEAEMFVKALEDLIEREQMKRKYAPFNLKSSPRKLTPVPPPPPAPESPNKGPLCFRMHKKQTTDEKKLNDELSKADNANTTKASEESTSEDTCKWKNLMQTGNLTKPTIMRLREEARKSQLPKRNLAERYNDPLFLSFMKTPRKTIFRTEGEGNTVEDLKILPKSDKNESNKMVDTDVENTKRCLTCKDASCEGSSNIPKPEKSLSLQEPSSSMYKHFRSTSMRNYSEEECGISKTSSTSKTKEIEKESNCLGDSAVGNGNQRLTCSDLESSDIPKLSKEKNLLRFFKLPSSSLCSTSRERNSLVLESSPQSILKEPTKESGTVLKEASNMRDQKMLIPEKMELKRETNSTEVPVLYNSPRPVPSQVKKERISLVIPSLDNNTLTHAPKERRVLALRKSPKILKMETIKEANALENLHFTSTEPISSRPEKEKASGISVLGKGTKSKTSKESCLISEHSTLKALKKEAKKAKSCSGSLDKGKRHASQESKKITLGFPIAGVTYADDTTKEQISLQLSKVPKPEKWDPFKETSIYRFPDFANVKMQQNEPSSSVESPKVDENQPTTSKFQVTRQRSLMKMPNVDFGKIKMDKENNSMATSNPQTMQADIHCQRSSSKVFKFGADNIYVDRSTNAFGCRVSVNDDMPSTSKMARNNMDMPAAAMDNAHLVKIPKKTRLSNSDAMTGYEQMNAVLGFDYNVNGNITSSTQRQPLNTETNAMAASQFEGIANMPSTSQGRFNYEGHNMELTNAAMAQAQCVKKSKKKRLSRTDTMTGDEQVRALMGLVFNDNTSRPNNHAMGLPHMEANNNIPSTNANTLPMHTDFNTFGIPTAPIPNNGWENVPNTTTGWPTNNTHAYMPSASRMPKIIFRMPPDNVEEYPSYPPTYEQAFGYPAYMPIRTPNMVQDQYGLTGLADVMRGNNLNAQHAAHIYGMDLTALGLDPRGPVPMYPIYLGHTPAYPHHAYFAVPAQQEVYTLPYGMRFNGF